MKKIILTFLIFSSVISQDLKISGLVLDKLNNNPLPFVNISLMGEKIGAVTDESGFFELTNLKPGVYNLQASFIGYKKKNSL